MNHRKTTGPALAAALEALNKRIARGEEFPDAAWLTASQANLDQKALERAYDRQHDTRRNACKSA